MSNAPRSCSEWEAFVRLLSRDRAILDVLLRGARQRYKEGVSLLDPTPAQIAEAWREAVREVVVEAFADEDAARGVHLDHQKTLAIVIDKASGYDVKTRHTLPNAVARASDEAHGEAKARSPPLQAVCEDRPPSLCIDVGDRLGTRASSSSDEDVLSRRASTSDDDDATAVLSGSNDDCPNVPFTKSDHREAGSPVTKAETTGAKTGDAGTTEPRSSVSVGSDQSLVRTKVSAAAAAAATSSPTSMLIQRHRASVGGGELGSLLSTFERQVERGAELVRRFEEAAKPRLPLDDDVDDVEADRGDHGKPVNGNTDLSTMTPSSTSSEEKHFPESCNMATNVVGITVATERPVPEPVRIGASPRVTNMGRDREPERTAKPSSDEEALLYLGGVPEQPSTGRGGGTNRSLSALGEQPSSPDTNTTLDVDNEEYEFTFDDEEMAVGAVQKSVQFTDESRWSTHEVRACFEQHELGELFYTTAELDSMLEEAESEEALERSSARLSQGGEIFGDAAAAAGGGSGSLLLIGGNQESKREAKSGAEQEVSFEKVLFDDEDSDYDF
eukprot:g8119.t1